MSGAAVGNTVLLKPPNNTPVIAAELVRLCIEAGFPPGVFNPRPASPTSRRSSAKWAARTRS
jgi:aldehyde dehydrogenase (NAD+)/betaine-aldehyde dehydrogenase